MGFLFYIYIYIYIYIVNSSWPVSSFSCSFSLALCFCAAVTAEMKSVSVMKGEMATLKSNVTELWRADEILLWL